MTTNNCLTNDDVFLYGVYIDAHYFSDNKLHNQDFVANFMHFPHKVA